MVGSATQQSTGQSYGNGCQAQTSQVMGETVAKLRNRRQARPEISGWGGCGRGENVMTADFGRRLFTRVLAPGWATAKLPDPPPSDYRGRAVSFAFFRRRSADGIRK